MRLFILKSCISVFSIAEFSPLWVPPIFHFLCRPSYVDTNYVLQVIWAPTPLFEKDSKSL